MFRSLLKISITVSLFLFICCAILRTVSNHFSPLQSLFCVCISVGVVGGLDVSLPSIVSWIHLSFLETYYSLFISMV
jgi:hypothetical protein